MGSGTEPFRNEMQREVHIQIQCPQCGGTMDFLEEAQVVRCEFCCSALLVTGRQGVLRYVLAPRIADPRKARTLAASHLRRQGRKSPRPAETFLFYSPFWRMQTTAFRWVFGQKPMNPSEQGDTIPPAMDRVKELFIRILDHTIPAFQGDLELGIRTLGVRTQVLRLHPFGKEHEAEAARFLPVEVGLERVQQECARLAEATMEDRGLVPDTVLHRLVGSRFSVVFFPLWYSEQIHQEGRDGVILDGVGGDVIQVTPRGDSILTELAAPRDQGALSYGEIRFLPFRCPNCGWDFPFRPASVIHFCPTCHRLWSERRGRWHETSYLVASPPAGLRWEDALWVPFWRFRARLTSGTLAMETLADLYRLAPPPRPFSLEKRSKQPIHFYVPAMRLNSPKATQDLAARFTFVQPEIDSAPFPRDLRPRSAGGSLTTSDADQMGAVVLGAMIPPKSRQALAWLREAQVQLADPRICFFPFERKDLFWKEANTGITFPHSGRAPDLQGAEP